MFVDYRRFFVVEERRLKSGTEIFLSYYPDESKVNNVKEAGDAVPLSDVMHIGVLSTSPRLGLYMAASSSMDVKARQELTLHKELTIEVETPGRIYFLRAEGRHDMLRFASGLQRLCGLRVDVPWPADCGPLLPLQPVIIEARRQAGTLPPEVEIAMSSGSSTNSAAAIFAPIGQVSTSVATAGRGQNPTASAIGLASAFPASTIMSPQHNNGGSSSDLNRRTSETFSMGLGSHGVSRRSSTNLLTSPEGGRSSQRNLNSQLSAAMSPMAASSSSFATGDAAAADGHRSRPASGAMTPTASSKQLNKQSSQQLNISTAKQHDSSGTTSRQGSAPNTPSLTSKAGGNGRTSAVPQPVELTIEGENGERVPEPQDHRKDNIDGNGRRNVVMSKASRRHSGYVSGSGISFGANAAAAMAAMEAQAQASANSAASAGNTNGANGTQNGAGRPASGKAPLPSAEEVLNASSMTHGSYRTGGNGNTSMMMSSAPQSLNSSFAAGMSVNVDDAAAKQALVEQALARAAAGLPPLGASSAATPSKQSRPATANDDGRMPVSGRSAGTDGRPGSRPGTGGSISASHVSHAAGVDTGRTGSAGTHTNRNSTTASRSVLDDDSDSDDDGAVDYAALARKARNPSSNYGGSNSSSSMRGNPEMTASLGVSQSRSMSSSGGQSTGVHGGSGDGRQQRAAAAEGKDGFEHSTNGFGRHERDDQTPARPSTARGRRDAYSAAYVSPPSPSSLAASAFVAGRSNIPLREHDAGDQHYDTGGAGAQRSARSTDYASHAHEHSYAGGGGAGAGAAGSPLSSWMHGPRDGGFQVHHHQQQQARDSASGHASRSGDDNNNGGRNGKKSTGTGVNLDWDDWDDGTSPEKNAYAAGQHQHQQQQHVHQQQRQQQRPSTREEGKSPDAHMPSSQRSNNYRDVGERKTADSPVQQQSRVSASDGSHGGHARQLSEAEKAKLRLGDPGVRADANFVDADWD